MKSASFLISSLSFATLIAIGGPAHAQSKTAVLDWQGLYQGALACAKPCQGIETSLDLSQKKGGPTYRLFEIVHGTSLITRASSGKATWLGGGRLELATKKGARVVLVGPGYVMFPPLERAARAIGRGKLRKVLDGAGEGRQAKAVWRP